ncbi:AhpC/TSA family protein [Amylibacter sp. SFDW26]|uniref:peroxiredoxin-like family protein n=1 Tax=Amylibacter sp. SFDW26 TaxID=2652722 RepID=UPI0012626DA4|nr:peroxiredoxin-like family protein [Amylibacter sp. SFDW26]KAB7616350.1 AhpC/TSA family protein [Amylibacter sp. SFDW26]
MLTPRQKTPDLSVETVAHGSFDLSSEGSEKFTLVVFYRGIHCPICANYLKELERLMPEFAQRGVNVIALSGDTQEKAAQMVEASGANKLRIGYGVSLEKAREWGLYTSEGIGKTSNGIEEPAIFAEPGLFLVRPDQTLYFASIQTMPFTRPSFKEMLGALDFVIAKDYPGRGEYTGAV